MSDNLDLSASITTEEPEIAATLSDLRYLVFQGKKGDTGDSAYEEAVELGFVGTEAEWIASLKGEKGQDGSPGAPGAPGAAGRDGVSPTVSVTQITDGHRVTITDATGAHTFDVMDGQGGGGGAVESVNGQTGAVVLDAEDVGALPDDTVIPSQIGQLSDNVGLVHYNSQTLTDAQKAQARTNIGAASMSDIPSLAAYRTASAQDAIDAAQDAAIAAKYTKPSGGIPDSDIASAAVWNTKGTYSKPSGGIPKSDLASAVQTSLGKADTALQQHQSLAGYATETYVQQQIAAIPAELPAVTASDNGKFLRVVSGAWAAQTVPSAESNSFGGGS